METIFLALIQQLNSSVFILLGLVALAAMLLHKTGRWIERFSSQDDRIKKVECLRDDMIEIRTKVNLIYQNTNRQPSLQSNSPLSLSKYGQEISENIKAPEIFKKYSAALTAELEKKNPQNAYDIQQESLNVVKEKMPQLIDASELNTMKNEAFQRGTILEDIIIVFAIYLRDHILDAKGLPISDVDKHAK